MDIKSLILEYGTLYYGIVFLWTFLEGETVVLLSGALAAQGLVDPLALFLCAWSGSFLGDQCWFMLGRLYGPRLLGRFPRLRPGTETALAFLRRYDTGFILSFRFVYGVRNFASLAMGMSGLSWRRFLALNFVAAGVWAGSFVGGGYLLGGVLGVVLDDAASSFGYVMLGVFVLIVGVMGVLHRVGSRRALALAAAEPADGRDG